ncbi:predicted protein [Naegleria gruberi]|uniref:Predicted protein n=1 Tax=Naegleria gruberi TaxID=5762 RepID=D2W093_NAEGR|nr:uncharacterized protein NAEGRDRAFT_74776 [Naegleria gruberi]EFC37574.1 predicted protein [Naegleria gruberi]|eukprot:XP_002670318.1 predicted protein [Naegleria gruberi strain NEG-M]
MGSKHAKDIKNSPTSPPIYLLDFVETADSVRRISQQKVIDLPVAKDLIRLCNKITVLEPNTKNPIPNSNIQEEDFECENKLTKIQSMNDPHLSESCLVNGNNIQSFTCRLLENNVNFNSGFWFIDIIIDPSNGKVTVCHRRKERVTGQFFDFTPHSASLPSIPTSQMASKSKQFSSSTSSLYKPSMPDMIRKLYTFEWKLYFELCPHNLNKIESVKMELVGQLDFSDSEIKFSDEEQEKIEQTFVNTAHGFDIKYDKEFEKLLAIYKKKEKKAKKK